VVQSGAKGKARRQFLPGDQDLQDKFVAMTGYLALDPFTASDPAVQNTRSNVSARVVDVDCSIDDCHKLVESCVLDVGNCQTTEASGKFSKTPVGLIC
jgi:hypothetical protein